MISKLKIIIMKKQYFPILLSILTYYIINAFMFKLIQLHSLTDSFRAHSVNSRFTYIHIHRQIDQIMARQQKNFGFNEQPWCVHVSVCAYIQSHMDVLPFSLCLFAYTLMLIIWQYMDVLKARHSLFYGFNSCRALP